jgi:branched-chain amino acid aminotransferase
MAEPWAYLNGEFLPQSRLHLSVHDAGFVFGATASDLCRTFSHRLFRLADHLNRFRSSCRYTRIPLLLSDSDLSQVAERLVADNAKLLSLEQDLALVMFATPGTIGYYAGQAGGTGNGVPTLCLHTYPLPFQRYVPLFEEGARLVTPSIRRASSAVIDPRAKQRSRLHWWLAEQEAHQTDPAASALLLDDDNHVTETASANFLAVRNGTVLSPPRESILGGISLQTVRELCAELDIRFEERPLSVYDCINADEALLTSTPYCLAGVSRINGVSLPWPGPVWLSLLERWNHLVAVDIRQQILANR